MTLAEAIAGLSGCELAFAGIRWTIESLRPTAAPARTFTLRPRDQAIDASVMTGRSRVFDIALAGLAEGPNITGGGLDFQIAVAELRVGYSLADWRRPEDMHAAIATDAAQIVTALRPPEAWSTWAFEFEIDSTLRIREVRNDKGEPAGALVIYGVRAEWEN